MYRIMSRLIGPKYRLSNPPAGFEVRKKESMSTTKGVGKAVK